MLKLTAVLLLQLTSLQSTGANQAVVDPCIAAVLDRRGMPSNCGTEEADPALYRTLAGLAEYLDRNALDQPHALIFLDSIHRWFGGGRYADSLARYDRLVEKDPRQAPTLRVFRRLMDRETPLDLQDLEAIRTNFDPFTARALHCDRLDLGSPYIEQLLRSARRPGYPRTHVLLALGWIEENGCTLELPDGFETDLIDDVGAHIDLAEPVTDLEVESAALLYWRGRRDLVPPAFIDQVVAGQQPDGGFSLSSAGEDPSNFHTSVLAFWLLLQHASPAPTHRRMLAPGE